MFFGVHPRSFRAISCLYRYSRHPLLTNCNIAVFLKGLSQKYPARAAGIRRLISSVPASTRPAAFAASAAAITSAAAEAAAPPVAERTATAPVFRAGTGFVNHDSAVLQCLAVESGDGSLSFSLGAHFHESEPPGPPAELIGGNTHGIHLTESAEFRRQFVLSDFIG